MAFRDRITWLIFLALVASLTACQGGPTLEPVASSTPAAGAMPTVTATPRPTATLPPSPSLTVTTTATPQPTPTPTSVLALAAAIQAGNVSALAEVWRLGAGNFEAQAWSSGGQYAALGTGAGLFVADAWQGGVLFFHPIGSSQQLAFAVDETQIAASVSRWVWLRGQQPNEIHVFSLPDGELQSYIELDRQFELIALAYQSDGSLVAAGNWLGENYQSEYLALLHFDPASGEQLAAYRIDFPERSFVRDLELSDSGEYLLVEFYESEQLQIFDVFGQAQGSFALQDFADLSFQGELLAFNTWDSPPAIQLVRVNGDLVGTVDSGDYPSFFRLDVAGETLSVAFSNRIDTYTIPDLQLENTRTYPCCISRFSPDLQSNMFIDTNWTITRLGSGQVQAEVPGLSQEPQALALDGQSNRLVLATTGYDEEWNYSSRFLVWDLASMQLEQTLVYQPAPRLTDQVEYLRFLADGSTLAVHQAGAAEIEFWDLESAAMVDRFAFSYPVTQVAVSVDGDLLLGVDRERGVEIWQRTRGERLVSSNQIQQYLGFYSPTFSLDGELAAVGGS
ncbi:MAG: WD40 repeat domain-containing protein, partial [Anaerolineales bacterium]|nr:WD40 repeat domain-containing protein [Anaerolineales bacterium]